MKYRIAGANATTGREVEIDVEAPTERDALADARQRGIFVSSVKQVAHAVPAKLAQPQAVSMSGRKLFAIVTAAVACGLTVTMICYVLFFAAAGATKRKTSSVYSKLGPDERAFVDAIRSGDAETAREQLVKPLNWKEVATPALKEVMGGFKLEVQSYDSDERKRERQF